jgi:hypothetical protein
MCFGLTHRLILVSELLPSIILPFDSVLDDLTISDKQYFRLIHAKFVVSDYFTERAIVLAMIE